MAKPGKWLYVVAGVIALGGSSVSVWRGCAGSMDSIRAMERRVMPGEGTFSLPAGRHQVFIEGESRVDGQPVGDGRSRGVRCNFGDAAEVRAPSHSEQYDLGGYAGRLQWELELAKPGVVAVSCDSDQPGQFVIAVGEGFTVGDLLVAIVGFAASIMVGLAVFFFTFIRRRSRNSRQSLEK